jgi:hypothetical protein
MRYHEKYYQKVLNIKYFKNSDVAKLSKNTIRIIILVFVILEA